MFVTLPTPSRFLTNSFRWLGSGIRGCGNAPSVLRFSCKSSSCPALCQPRAYSANTVSCSTSPSVAGGWGGGPAWTPCLPRGSASVSSPGQPSGKNFVLRSDLPLPLPSLPPCSPSLGMQAPPWSSSHPRPIHLSAPRGWQGGAGRKEPACSSRHPFCWRLLPCGALVDLCVAVGEVIA